MWKRCTNASVPGYRSYGARGIAVCDRWRDFEKFVDDMGPRPHGMSIDRVDVNGNYEPKNCRWATALEQNNNRTDNIHLEHAGEVMTVAQWARRLGMRAGLVHQRLSLGWSVADALTIPPKAFHRYAWRHTVRGTPENDGSATEAPGISERVSK